MRLTRRIGQLQFLLAQSSIYASVIAQKLAKDTEDRRKRDEAAGKRAAQRERKEAQKQAASGNDQQRRSGRAAVAAKASTTSTIQAAKRESVDHKEVGSIWCKSRIPR